MNVAKDSNKENEISEVKTGICPVIKSTEIRNAIQRCIGK
jgi:hypothetical protein